jgi:hypothetical protein
MLLGIFEMFQLFMQYDLQHLLSARSSANLHFRKCIPISPTGPDCLSLLQSIVFTWASGYMVDRLRG